jgi:Tfp pilus assembly protein FimT
MMFRNKNKQKGFSIAELLIVFFVIAIIAVLALPQIISSRRLFRFAGVQREVVSALRDARQQAIGQRTAITFSYDNVSKQIVFSGGNFGAPGNANNQVTPLTGDGIVPDELIYGRPSGAPAAALGDGTNMTSLSANRVEITFQSDGSVLDSDNNPQNTALFFYSSQTPGDTAFAVSVLGAGGRAKLWKYNLNANAYVE